MERLIAYYIANKEQFEKEAIAQGFELFISYGLRLLRSKKRGDETKMHESSGIEINNHALGQMGGNYFVVYPKIWVAKKDRRDRSNLIKMCDGSDFRA